MPSISLIVTDIDGCLIESATTKFNLALFERLQAWNQRSRAELDWPPITVCTGRPSPFCEAIGRAMDTHLPVLCESGGVLYDYERGTLRMNPAWENGAGEALYDLRHAVEARFLNDGRPLLLEPGKLTEVTLIPYPPLDVEGIWDEAVEFHEGWDETFHITRTLRVVNFTHRDLHKGAGVRWLAGELGVPLEQVAGFGDAVPDVPFLGAVGLAGCPANAHEQVKAVSDFVAPGEFEQGFLQFLDVIESRLKSG